eukprot:6467119-Amphidinium_carterae.1
MQHPLHCVQLVWQGHMRSAANASCLSCKWWHSQQDLPKGQHRAQPESGSSNPSPKAHKRSKAPAVTEKCKEMRTS